MLEFMCFVFGMYCSVPDLPPAAHAPAMESVSIDTSWAVKPPTSNLPTAVMPTMFDPSCNIQPPHDIQKHIVAAHRRFPHGATECEMARQLFVECQTFDPKCFNPASGTIGVSQFKPRTADQLGIDPWDARESIFGMAEYVVWCEERFTPGLGGRTRKDVKALRYVCYNWGLGNTRNSAKAHGWVMYFGPYGAQHYVPGESSNYVARVVIEDE